MYKGGGFSALHDSEPSLWKRFGLSEAIDLPWECGKETTVFLSLKCGAHHVIVEKYIGQETSKKWGFKDFKVSHAISIAQFGFKEWSWLIGGETTQLKY